MRPVYTCNAVDVYSFETACRTCSFGTHNLQTSLRVHHWTLLNVLHLSYKYSVYESLWRTTFHPGHSRSERHCNAGMAWDMPKRRLFEDVAAKGQLVEAGSDAKDTYANGVPSAEHGRVWTWGKQRYTMVYPPSYGNFHRDTCDSNRWILE